MMRFSRKRSYGRISFILAVLLCLAVLWFFDGALSGVSEKTSRQQMQNLELAFTRSIAHCYAVRGHYPESLEYLQEHYHISYDTERYFVDYQVLGENIFPDLTIIEK